MTSNVIALLNHGPTALDWLILLTTSDFCHRIGRAFAFMKKTFAYIPVIGWVGALAGCVTLNRNWKADESRLIKLMPKFNDEYPKPWIFATYPEGTRLNPKKLQQAQTYAKEKGYRVYTNLLQPRVKGFRFLINHLRNSVKYVIDWTIIYFDEAPTIKDFITKGRLNNKYTHLHLKIYPINTLPTNDDDIDNWLRERWTEKERIIDFVKKGKSKGQELYRDPYKGRLCFIFWTIIVGILLQYLFKWNGLYTIIWIVTNMCAVTQCYIERKIDESPQGLYGKKIN